MTGGKINVNWRRNITALAKRITTVIPWRSDNPDRGFRAKDTEKQAEEVVPWGWVAKELASWQEPQKLYFLSCRGLCSHPDSEIGLRNKETSYSKLHSHDLPGPAFAIKTKTLIRFSADDWQLFWMLVRELRYAEGQLYLQREVLVMLLNTFPKQVPDSSIQHSNKLKYF